MVPLVGNICTISTNLLTNGTIGKEIGANGKSGIPLVSMVQMLPTNGTIGRTPNTRRDGLKLFMARTTLLSAEWKHSFHK